jgi:Amt family ammonium transporter
MKAMMIEKGLRWLLPLASVLVLMGSTTLFAQDTEVTEAEPAAAAAVEEAPAEEAGPDAASVLADVDVLWTCLAAFLVFFMQAGFALVEAGFTRAKNCCNIIMKNLMDFSIGSLSFWLVGFGLMFGVSASGFVGTNGFLFDADAEGAIVPGAFGWAFLIFQTVFAATAATIVSGAMAERTKFVSYLIYSIAITVIVYPIFGSWCWNGLVGAGEQTGWLETMGFLDFAGSTVVHSIGGWCALAGAIVIGARRGKYKDGKPMPIPGHNIPLAALGVFILWLGWFGFNPGSTTAVGGGDLARIAVTTNLSAAAGAVTAMIATWVMFGKPDVSFALNGALAGLVAITAGCDIMTPAMAALTGAIGGVLVVFSCLAIEKMRIDDPVGAVSVHGVCGAWGTIAIGLFSSAAGGEQLVTQVIGVAAGFLWAFPVSFVIFYLIKVTIGLRVSEEEELAGLDITEHGMHAYPPSMIDGVGSMESGSMSGAVATSVSPVPAHTGA